MENTWELWRITIILKYPVSGYLRLIYFLLPCKTWKLTLDLIFKVTEPIMLVSWWPGAKWVSVKPMKWPIMMNPKLLHVLLLHQLEQLEKCTRLTKESSITSCPGIWRVWNYVGHVYVHDQVLMATIFGTS